MKKNSPEIFEIFKNNKLQAQQEEKKTESDISSEPNKIEQNLPVPEINVRQSLTQNTDAKKTISISNQTLLIVVLIWIATVIVFYIVGYQSGKRTKNEPVSIVTYDDDVEGKSTDADQSKVTQPKAHKRSSRKVKNVNSTKPQPDIKFRVIKLITYTYNSSGKYNAEIMIKKLTKFQSKYPQQLAGTIKKEIESKGRYIVLYVYVRSTAKEASAILNNYRHIQIGESYPFKNSGFK